MGPRLRTSTCRGGSASVLLLVIRMAHPAWSCVASGHAHDDIHGLGGLTGLGACGEACWSLAGSSHLPTCGARDDRH